MFAAAISWRSAARASSLAALLAAAPASAEIDPVKTQANVQKLIDGYVKLAEGALQPQGKVTAVREGDHVKVTTPPMLVTGPDVRVEVPSSVVLLRETMPDRIAFDVTLPSRITGEKSGDAPDALLITLGSQTIEGVIIPSLFTFERLDLRLEDLDISTNEGAVTLGAFDAHGTAEEGAEGLWASAYTLSMDRLAVVGPQKAPLFALGRFENTFYIDRFDLPAWAALQKKHLGGNPWMSMTSPSDEQMQQLNAEMFQMLPELLDGASGGVGWRISGVDVAATPDAPPFKLGAGEFGLAFAPDGEFYGFGIDLEVDGPAVDPSAAPVPADLMPSYVRADAGFRRLPLAMLWQMMSPTIQKAMELESRGQMTPEAQAELDQQFEMVPMAAMGMAAEAGSFAEIEGIELRIGPARVTAKGVGPLVPGLPEPPLRVEAAIEGLDQLGDEVQALEPELRDQITPVLVMLRGLGKTEARDNKVLYTYLVEQAPDGTILINGVSLDDLDPGRPK